MWKGALQVFVGTLCPAVFCSAPFPLEKEVWFSGLAEGVGIRRG